MKKTAIIFTAILFVFALFIGNSIAEQQRGQTGAYQTQDYRGTAGAHAQTQQINRASEITGMSVRNHQGEELGEVNDVVFDNEGNISYLILSRGGLLGVGADLVPIPWQAQDITIQEDAVILSLDQQRLEQAPSFSSGEWENLEDQGFQQRVHGYYGQQRQEGLTPDRQHRQEGMQPDTQRQEGLDTDTQRREDATPGTELRDSVTPHDQRFPERAPTGRGVPN
jgi:sporulation protein YlmC with PRC-barrel domain